MALNMIHLDCGRKFFAPAEIKKVIDIASASGFNALELAFGNDGFRFFLNDMSLGGFSSQEVSRALHEGNVYYDAHPKFGDPYVTERDELTEAEMDEIIAYAGEKKMEIIPLLETPGHMHTLLTAMEKLGFQDVRYMVAGLHLSHGTVDVKNEKALRLLRELILKYARYFASRGSRWFNVGVDEYANDFAVNDEWVMGVNQLIAEGGYPLLMDYLNSLCGVVKSAGLRPMAFNDCIYYGGDTRLEVDKDLAVAYWTGGWRGYLMAPAELIREMGHELVNCHGDYYWVVNQGGAKCTPEKAEGFDVHAFPGDWHCPDPLGGLFCIWCDGPGCMTAEETVAQAAPTMEAFGRALQK